MELTRATWTDAQMNDLPDSSFLYIEPGGKKDSEGKTTPRSLRHFPVKDAQGNPDPAHVRNALARIPQSNVPASVKAEATRKAQAMLQSIDSGRSVDEDETPQDIFVRATQPFEVNRSSPDAMPTLHGVGAVYGEWTEINSRVEGHFMERFAPGAFTKAIKENRDQIRCLFHHGQDPSIGYKPLGTITDLSESDRKMVYDVDLFDADYVRALVPGLEAGVYGSSFRFGTVKKNDQTRGVANSKGLLERTIREASMRELGPTPFPAYIGTSAGLRSITDEFVLSRFPAEHLVAEAALRTDEPDLIGEIRWRAERYVASGETDADAMRTIVGLLDEITVSGAEEEVPALSSEAVQMDTSELLRAADKEESTPLWGLDRDEKEVAPSWRL
jgi:HK97 family phage prohead protease